MTDFIERSLRRRGGQFAGCCVCQTRRDREFCLPTRSNGLAPEADHVVRHLASRIYRLHLTNSVGPDRARFLRAGEWTYVPGNL